MMGVLFHQRSGPGAVTDLHAVFKIQSWFIGMTIISIHIVKALFYVYAVFMTCLQHVYDVFTVCLLCVNIS